MEDISLMVHLMPHRLVSAVYWKHTLWCDTTAMTCNGTNHFLNEDISGSNSETTLTFTDIPRSNISYELWWCININTRRHHCSEVYTHICWTVCRDPADFSTETLSRCWNESSNHTIYAAHSSSDKLTGRNDLYCGKNVIWLKTIKKLTWMEC